MPDRDDIRRLYASFGQSASQQGYRSFHQGGIVDGLGLPMEEDLASMEAATDPPRPVAVETAVPRHGLDAGASAEVAWLGSSPTPIPPPPPLAVVPDPAAVPEISTSAPAAATPLNRIFERLLREQP